VAAVMKVVQVPEGSVILLTGVYGSEVDGWSFEDQMVREVTRAAGHDRFTIISVVDDVDIEVWGPDVDLAAKVRELLAEGDE
jgi:hypothetical protein